MKGWTSSCDGPCTITNLTSRFAARVKRRASPGIGFKTFESERELIAGIEKMGMIKKALMRCPEVLAAPGRRLLLLPRGSPPGCHPWFARAAWLAATKPHQAPDFLPDRVVLRRQVRGCVLREKRSSGSRGYGALSLV